jgi:ABC-type transport system substrate-binding protein
MLLNGEADLIDIDRNYATDLNNATILHFTEPAGITPTLVYSNGVLKKYSGILSNSATDALFTHHIETGGSINFVGSGLWDGNGIPADFFSDIHVRKGFNYAFDWDALNSNYFGGTAVQRTGPIIKPLMGYNDTQSKYYHDTDLAISEFTAAWGGEVIDHGFAMTIAYNSGNSYRQMVAENLKTNIEALNPNFHINVINLDWNIYLQEAHAKHLPIYLVGWMGDIPHPHNWVSVHLTGAYAADTALPSALITKYQTMVNTCLAMVGDDARTCYEGIQNETYLDALGIYLLQGTDVTWINTRIQGYYLNSALPGTRYYDLYKTKLPVSVNVDPVIEQSLIFTPTDTISTMLTIPPGAVDDPIQIIAVPDLQVYNNQPEFLLGKISFNLEAYATTGELIPNLTINEPLTITVNYDPASYTPDQESGLILYYWNNTSWEDAACGPYSRDLVNHIL